MMPIIASLLSAGLGKVANALLVKGAEWVEQKSGLKIEMEKQPSPEQLMAFKQFEMDHEEELQRIQLEQDKLSAEAFKLALGDLDSARKRESDIVTSANAPMLNKLITPILALVVLLMTFALFAGVMFAGDAVDATRKDLMVYVLGVLSTVSTQVIAYYFGSSSGSQSKDATIKNLTK